MAKTDVFTEEDFGGIIGALYSYMHGGNAIADKVYHHTWDYSKHVVGMPENDAAQIMFLTLMRDVEELHDWWVQIRDTQGIPTRAEVDAQTIKEMYEAQHVPEGR